MRLAALNIPTVAAMLFAFVDDVQFNWAESVSKFLCNPFTICQNFALHSFFGLGHFATNSIVFTLSRKAERTVCDETALAAKF